MMRGMRRAMVTTAGTTAGMMTVRVVARAMRAVNVVRIVPVTAIPGGRTPGRHDTGGCQCPEREHSGAVGIITIHRASVIITVNGETGSIIAGICPGGHITMRIHGDTAAATHGHTSVRSYCHKARAEHHG